MKWLFSWKVYSCTNWIMKHKDFIATFKKKNIFEKMKLLSNPSYIFFKELLWLWSLNFNVFVWELVSAMFVNIFDIVYFYECVFTWMFVKGLLTKCFNNIYLEYIYWKTFFSLIWKYFFWLDSDGLTTHWFYQI